MIYFVLATVSVSLAEQCREAPDVHRNYASEFELFRDFMNTQRVGRSGPSSFEMYSLEVNLKCTVNY